ncbi:MAG: RidA family protein [Gammaproteobacteria bacterium]|nr:RidA family protein [Gammaproteobacteria bacterium]
MNRTVNAGIAKHVGSYSDAIEMITPTRILYVSGTPGIDSDTGDLPAGFAEQAELAWQNIIKILAAAEMSVADIVKLTQHLIRREDIAGYRDIRSRYLGSHSPASMLTFLPSLVWPNMLIELEVTAAK